MKQFYNIFKFELNNYLKNKMFVGITVVIVLVLAIVLSFPRAKAAFGSDKPDEPSGSGERTKIAINVNESMDKTVAFSFFQNALGKDYEVKLVDKTENELKKSVKDGKYKNAIYLTSPLSYKYITGDKEMTDSTTYIVDEILLKSYQISKMASSGISADEAQNILGATVNHDLLITGTDQTQSFLYTYVIIMMLYIALILYGQFVCQSVVTEKSSRAMELLVTSAKPTSLMFGKVLGSGFAGLIQLVVILFSAFGFYSLNKDFWADNEAIKSVFGMPLEIVLYAILFFILGFFIYAFMYGALGSLASRPEDLNTLVMPVTFLFVAAFIIVVSAITGGNLNSTLMVVCSYIPFTSPMAMFARIAMSSVPTYEIVISVAILIGSEVLIGYLASVIYRAGVLMYGNPPKFKEILKIFKNKKQA